MPKYFVFPRKLIVFFLISHIASYLLTTYQTSSIKKEVRKSGD